MYQVYLSLDRVHNLVEATLISRQQELAGMPGLAKMKSWATSEDTLRALVKVLIRRGKPVVVDDLISLENGLCGLLHLFKGGSNAEASAILRDALKTVRP